jgi:probable addiction module antidote protein
MRSKDFKEYLLEQLKDPEEAAAYINAAMEDEDPRVFLIAIQDVAEAMGGMSWLAKEAHLNRESLYKMLSKKGNPQLHTLISILAACGLELAVQIRTANKGSTTRGKRSESERRLRKKCRCTSRHVPTTTNA